MAVNKRLLTSSQVSNWFGQNASATIPVPSKGLTFVAGVTGSYEPLASITVPSGGLSQIVFGSIPTGYAHLQIRQIARSSNATSNDISINFNNDFSANYTSHVLYGDGTSAVAGATGANASNLTYITISNSSRAANSFAAGIIDILDYSSINKNKTIRTLAGRDDNSAGIIMLSSGAYFSTNAITSIRLFSVDTFAANSSFSLYGIKG